MKNKNCKVTSSHTDLGEVRHIFTAKAKVEGVMRKGQEFDSAGGMVSGIGGPNGKKYGFLNKQYFTYTPKRNAVTIINQDITLPR